MTKLYLTGGYLGSGKTTAICGACEMLIASGKRVAVISNDQGGRLVDGSLVKQLGFSAREVTGGCFCCRFEALETAISSLRDSDLPEYIFAESVGSCTDIVATVVKPLQRSYPDLSVILTVFLDARLLASAENGQAPSHDADLNYIFYKQPEEADLIILNKADLLDGSDRKAAAGFVGKRFPGKPVRFQNSLQPAGLRAWLKELETMKVPSSRKSLEIDYALYGAGEAKLGWLDEELEIYSETGRAIESAVVLVNAIYAAVRGSGCPIGHLKFLLHEGTWQKKISFTSLAEPQLRQTENPLRLTNLTLLINARVHCTAERLSEMISGAKADVAARQPVRFRTLGAEAFSPGYPRPTHRIN